jgi:geranylgeranyl diphosphate synthase type I
MSPASSSQERAAFVALLDVVRRRVDERLPVWLAPKLASANAVSAEVGAVAESVASLAVRGGKRMRPALLAAAYEAFGGQGGLDPIELPMIAIELLQVYLLIHDDWMDDDPVRRGGPAVHVTLRARLGSHKLGDAGAILAGDLASAFAQEALLGAPLAAERVLRAARGYAALQEEVVSGQLAEMQATGSGSVGPAPAPTVETIHALKTASYTVTGPLAVGAFLAGADDAAAARLGNFGRPLGVAFQLRDDLLGIFGDPSATGKPVWNDIRQGKRTALISEMRGHAEAEALLARVLGRTDAPDADVEAVVRMMESCGARARVEARVQELVHEARRALDALALPEGNARSALGGAVTALAERSS